MHEAAQGWADKHNDGKIPHAMRMVLEDMDAKGPTKESLMETIFGLQETQRKYDAIIDPYRQENQQPESPAAAGQQLLGGLPARMN